MKWSFAGGLESNSVGFNLLLFLGNKKEATQKKSSIHQNMHNLQRKFKSQGFTFMHFFFNLIIYLRTFFLVINNPTVVEQCISVVLCLQATTTGVK